MRSPKRSRQVPHADLFQPTSPEPTWHALPSEVREKAIDLLAQLLREHPRSDRLHHLPTESNDE